MPTSFPSARHRVAAVFLAASGLAHAAPTPPDAGSLLQRLEQDSARPRLPPAPPQPAASAADKRPAGASDITVAAFRFEGNHLLDDARLAAVVAPWLGRPLGLADLQQAAAAVAKSYRDAGWVVRALLPRQDVTDGVVRIRIVEARFGGTQWRGDAPRRVAPERLAALVEAAQPPGAPLRSDALDRALLLLGEMPGVDVTGDLVPGPADGETSLRLQAVDQPLLRGQLSLDNGGSRATGAGRALATLEIASPTGRGDRAALQLVGSAGSQYAHLDYTLPAGSAGWRVGAMGSLLAYKLVTPDFEALDALGRSSSAGLQASYPWWRSRRGSLDASFQAARQRFDNRSAGFTTSHYGVDTVTATLSGHAFDDLGGGGDDQASLGWVGGRVHLAGSLNQADDAAGLRTAGEFAKWCFALSRLQTLASGFSAQASWSSQLASRNLDGSQKLYLGGPDGVRAYPAGEAGGSDGMLVNLDLRKALSEHATVSAFYDWGLVREQHTPSADETDPNRRLALQGLGLAASWRPRPDWTLQATWSHRLGSNPDPTSTGKDQDGSLVRNRFWLQASASFR